MIMTMITIMIVIMMITKIFHRFASQCQVPTRHAQSLWVDVRIHTANVHAFTVLLFLLKRRNDRTRQDTTGS